MGQAYLLRCHHICNNNDSHSNEQALIFTHPWYVSLSVSVIGGCFLLNRPSRLNIYISVEIHSFSASKTIEMILLEKEAVTDSNCR